MAKQALVLCGGSIRGAFQAGALEVWLGRGNVPDCGIWGVSAGALNGGFAANLAGLDVTKNQYSRAKWKDYGTALVNYWKDEITAPNTIFRPRVGAIADLLFNTFDGVVNIDDDELDFPFPKQQRLKSKVAKTIQHLYVKECPVPFSVGCVDLASGDFSYARGDNALIAEYVLASTAVPIMFPVQVVCGKSLVDGGVRDMAPLREAIESADEVTVIACNPMKINRKTTVKTNNILEYFDRLSEILEHETLTNDLAVCKNTMNKHKKLTVIRPAEDLEIKINDFDAKQIEAVLKKGQEAAGAELDANLETRNAQGQSMKFWKHSAQGNQFSGDHPDLDHLNWNDEIHTLTLSGPPGTTVWLYDSKGFKLNDDVLAVTIPNKGSNKGSVTLDLKTLTEDASDIYRWEIWNNGIVGSVSGIEWK